MHNGNRNILNELEFPGVKKEPRPGPGNVKEPIQSNSKLSLAHLAIYLRIIHLSSGKHPKPSTLSNKSKGTPVRCTRAVNAAWEMWRLRSTYS